MFPRIKEEFFPNGKLISVNVYRKVTEPGQKAKAWTVYRDEIKDLEALAEALQKAIPASCNWEGRLSTNNNGGSMHVGMGSYAISVR